MNQIFFNMVVKTVTLAVVNRGLEDVNVLTLSQDSHN